MYDDTPTMTPTKIVKFLIFTFVLGLNFSRVKELPLTKFSVLFTSLKT